MMRDSLRMGLVVLGVGCSLMACETRALAADTVQVPFRIAEATQPPTALDQVDRLFARAVEAMSNVLFFRIGQSEQTYVQFQQTEYFVRDAGSDGPFIKMDSRGQPTDVSLDDREVQRRVALGEFERDASGASILTGVIETDSGTERPVEFLAIKINDDKYILRDGEFRKLLPLRGLLSTTEVLSPQEVQRAAEAGELAVDPEALKDGGAKPYEMTEAVGGAQLVVLWLALGAVFFTLFMGGYNLWGFRHAVEVVRGKFDNPAEPGEVTHFQALASALSATVGLGNIAGVTIAMASGGPGAFFWMVACGLFGMTSKFVECTLGQKYRQVKPDGSVLGGPMQYLHAGLKELGLGPLGYLLSIVFAVMCILASFGGGNMFQANQSGQQVLSLVQSEDHHQLEELEGDIKAAAQAKDYPALEQLQTQKTELQQSMQQQARVFKPVFGVILAFMVGIVIIGGIKRIGAAAEKVVPTMCVMYMAACLYIIARHASDVPGLLAQIFNEAFTPQAFGGGMLGVLVVGVQRAAFSNEAGVGSAAIAHSAARTEEPVREGTVALLGPFIDTVVVCTMTALVILITGAWNNEQWLVNQGLKGTTLTSRAFAEEISWFPTLLTVAVVLFAYSTLISWSYYGERCWERLFGPRSTVVYKVIYVIAAFAGVLVNLGAVLDFSDMMILSMAFPNIFGLLLLSPGVRRDLRDYWRRYKANEFQTFSHAPFASLTDAASDENTDDPANP